ncbi:hypothetical protein P8S55_13145 [Halomonas sp. M1]|uniref:hypothetical protein n=1 Tax=Halomonas sp. M1 TaxID=3035470 RepID=UPI002485070D|nr:hypothetical protein [Halomonas sp. M1]WFE70722.1 hypothetical protein P8S55_13145 [Halomonas sp. M1]
MDKTGRPQNTMREILSRNNFKGLRVKMLSQYDDDVIDGLYYAACQAESHIKKQSLAELDSLKNDNNMPDSDRNELELFLVDDNFEAELIRKISEEMVIAALYKTVEIVIKRMLAVSGLFSENEVRSFFRIKELKRLAGERVANLEELPGFSSYDELRCINNCIKHSGKVSDELSNFSGWSKNEKIEYFWEHYLRIKPGVRKFVTSLSIKIIEKM